jgi:hypothetical protein
MALWVPKGTGLGGKLPSVSTRRLSSVPLVPLVHGPSRQTALKGTGLGCTQQKRYNQRRCGHLQMKSHWVTTALEQWPTSRCHHGPNQISQRELSKPSMDQGPITWSQNPKILGVTWHFLGLALHCTGKYSKPKFKRRAKVTTEASQKHTSSTWWPKKRLNF